MAISACEAQEEPAPIPDPLSWAVDELGPYAVGYLQLETQYRPRAASADRSIPLHLWYPATVDDPSTAETAVYEYMFQDENAFVGASPEESIYDGGYPVLLYSHGNQGFGGSSHFLMRALASHGWTAIAPDHVGNTLSTHSSPRPLGLWLWRSEDLRAALDALEPGGVAAAALPSPARTEAVVLAGHSFGGYSTWATAGSDFDLEAIEARCEAGEYEEGQCSTQQLEAFAEGGQDTRVAAGIPMAGGSASDWFGEGGQNAVEIPMLQMSGSLDAGAVEGVWDSTDSVDMRWMDIQGGCHQLFGLGACSEVPTEDGFHIAGSYARAFSRHVLIGDSSDRTLALLDGTELLDPRVSFQRRPAED